MDIGGTVYREQSPLPFVSRGGPWGPVPQGLWCAMTPPGDYSVSMSSLSDSVYHPELRECDRGHNCPASVLTRLSQSLVSSIGLVLDVMVF